MEHLENCEHKDLVELKLKEINKLIYELKRIVDNKINVFDLEIAFSNVIKEFEIKTNKYGCSDDCKELYISVVN